MMLRAGSERHVKAVVLYATYSIQQALPSHHRRQTQFFSYWALACPICADGIDRLTDPNDVNTVAFFNPYSIPCMHRLAGRLEVIL
jgi:hypothetical protein